MSILDTLVTDRTQADVDRVKYLQSKTMTASELAEYLAGMKGSYNYTDLNRVGQAVAYVADELMRFGGFRISVNPKVNWTIQSIPTTNQMTTFIQNLITIKNCYPYIYPSFPSTMHRLTFEQANEIEELIKTADEALQNVLATSVQSGMANSGMIWGEFT